MEIITLNYESLAINQCLSTTGSKHIHWRESTSYAQHDDDDDAKIQILKKPITYATCDQTRNINFNLEPIKEDEGAAVSVKRNDVADGGYSNHLIIIYVLNAQNQKKWHFLLNLFLVNK